MHKRKIWTATAALIVILSLLVSACSSGTNNGGNGGDADPNAGGAAANQAAEGAGESNEQPAGGDASGEKAEIRFSTWYGAGDIEVWKEVITRFETANPNIKVKFEPLDFGTFWQKIPTQLAGNSAPDVIGSHVGIVYGYVEKDQFEPLDDYLNAGSHSIDELPEALAAEGQWPKDNPQQYALPWRFTGGALFVNTTAMKEAGVEYPENGWTIDEFLEAAQKMTTDKRFGFNAPGFTMNAGLMAAFGTEPTTPDKLQSNYNAPEVLEYKTWLHDLIHKHKVSPNPRDNDPNVDPFVAGKVAMTIGGAWNFPVYRDIKDFEWDVAPMPTRNGISKTYAGPDMISMNKDSKNKEAAWKFMEFAVFDPQAQELLRKTGLPMLKADVANQAIVDEIAAQKPAHFKVFLDGATANGIGYAFTKKFTEIAKLESDADVKILQDPNADIKKELETLHKQVNDELAKP